MPASGSRNATAVAFSAKARVSMCIIGYLGAGEERAATATCSRCPGWSGCAVTTTGGWRATDCWPTVSVCWSVTASYHVPVVERPRAASRELPSLTPHGRGIGDCTRGRVGRERSPDARRRVAGSGVEHFAESPSTRARAGAADPIRPR